jgi:hypothetical protein
MLDTEELKKLRDLTEKRLDTYLAEHPQATAIKKYLVDLDERINKKINKKHHVSTKE